MRTGSIRLDVATAYVVTAARVGAWAVVSALVYRRWGPTAFGVLALIRATAGFLTYTSLGLGPAMVRSLAEANRPQSVIALAASDPPTDVTAGTGTVLEYAVPSGRKMANTPREATPVQRVYTSGLLLALLLALVGTLAAGIYSEHVEAIHPDLPPYFLQGAAALALWFGIGVVLRILGDVPAAVLQVRGAIALDNFMQAGAEAAWVIFVVFLWASKWPGLESVGISFAMANVLLLLARYVAVRVAHIGVGVGFRRGGADWATLRRLLGFGLAVTLAQAADFFYAPMDYLLIDWLIDTRSVGVYAPAIQIDAGLAVLGSGLATVLLPRAAVAHAAGDVARLRRYYVRGTLATVALVAPCAAVVWVASPWIFRLWLGDEMPATRAILPLVLLHNLIGNSGFVGRSVLLAMGRTRAFAASVLAAALLNVAASYTFVMLGMGLRGIVLGTIVAVCARCLAWMPWYVMRTLSRLAAEQPTQPAVAVAETTSALPPGGPP